MAAFVSWTLLRSPYIAYDGEELLSGCLNQIKILINGIPQQFGPVAYTLTDQANSVQLDSDVSKLRPRTQIEQLALERRILPLTP